MRRVIPILLALVLVPLHATASWYRCAYDGVSRSACCCPAKTAQPERRGAEPAARLRAACCCTVTHATSEAPARRTSQPASLDDAPVALAIMIAVPQPSSRAGAGAGAGACLGRPRAQDPPDTLFSRRCSLLL